MPSRDRATLPPKLLEQFRCLRRRLWQTRFLEWSGLVIVALISLFFVVWISDRVWDTPLAWRMALLACIYITLLGFASWLFVRWGLPLTRWTALGNFVRRWDRKSGDRVLAAVSLTEEAAQAAESPRLREAALGQIANQLSQTDLTPSISRVWLRRASTSVIGTTLLLGLVLLLAPHASMNAAVRTFRPWKDTPRYTFVQLGDIPSTQIIPHGEPTMVSVPLKEDSPWSRPQGHATVHGQSLVAPLERGAYTFELPGLVNEETLSVRIGDAQTRIQIVPMHRPGLEHLEANIILPTYLQHSPQVTEITTGNLEVLTGSRLHLTGTVTRALAKADFRGVDSQALRIEGQQFHTHTLKINERPQILEIKWEDQLGLLARDPLRVELRPVQDKPPRVELITGTSAALALLAHDTVSFGLRAEDDFGLRSIGYVWGPSGAKPEELWPDQSRQSKEGGAEVVSLENDLTFAPNTLGLAPGKWQFWAYAQDFQPEALPSFSSAKVLQVLTDAQHASMVRAQFRQVQEQLESIAREEASLLQENQALAQAENLDPAALDKQQKAEQETADKLAELTTQSQALLEQALKNDSIDTTAMDSWGDMLAAMQSVSQTGMPQASQSLGQASNAAQGGNSGQAKQSLAEAIAQQEENLKQLADAMGEAQQTEEKLEAATFVNRLRGVATAEERIATEMKATVFQSAGLAPVQLNKSAMKALGLLSDSHDLTRNEVNYLMTDLEHYHRRTDKPIYGKVHGEMVQSKVPIELSQITRRLQHNQHGRVIQSSLRWAKQFHAWADALAADKEPEKEQPTQEGAGESEGKTDTETLLAIMRIVQREMALRDQTRALDRRRNQEDYHEAAQVLAQEQRDLGFAVAALLARVFGPEVQMRLRAAGSAMNDAALLLEKPETGGETIAAETEVIELLGSAAKNASQMSGNSKGMQALAELLSLMEVGNSPGGNPEGAASNLASNATTGVTTEDNREHRQIEKTTGYQNDSFPEEFREALGKFFEAREALIGAPAAEGEARSFP